MANTSGYGYLLGPAPQFFDANGKPLVGGKLFVYIAGTTTKAVTYSDFYKTENTNPVVLNYLGTCMLIVPSENLYKIVLYDRKGNLLLTRDNVSVSYEQQIIYMTANKVESSDSTVDVTATTDPDTGIVTYDLSIKDEIDRATEAEKGLADSIEAEKKRAEGVESTLSKSITNETKRATEAEKGLADAIEAEKTRAEGVESTLSKSITNETKRATEAEKASRTEIVAGYNITVEKTVGTDGQDVYTVSGEREDNLVDDVRVNGASVVTDKVANIDVPVAGTSSPLMDGKASVGNSLKYAREDHVHPTDTSRASASHAHGSINNDGEIGTTENLPVITGTGGAVTTGSFSTTASAVGTSSAAGTANTFSRGDHVHSISLDTGDSDGQVKIAGSNVSVAGWDKFALSQHQGTKQYHIQVNNTSLKPNGWCPIVRVTKTSGYGSYDAIRVSGTFYYARNNWESEYDFVIDFQAIINISGNTASLCLGKTKMNPVPLRLIKIADRDYELQYNASVYNMDYDIYYQVEGYAKKYTTFYTTYKASTSTGTEIPSGKLLEGNIAYEADKLSTARTIQTDLSSTSSARFDGTDNITTGVTGTLPVANGGTGTNAASKSALTSTLINYLSAETSTPKDADYYVSQYAGGGTSNTSFVRRPVSALWEYIKDKISSVLRLTASDYAGKAVTAGTADKAVADNRGNNIVNTYATKTELNEKGITVKKISGEQVICFE